jgi:hypothetical protein
VAWTKWRRAGREALFESIVMRASVRP